MEGRFHTYIICIASLLAFYPNLPQHRWFPLLPWTRQAISVCPSVSLAADMRLISEILLPSTRLA